MSKSVFVPPFDAAADIRMTKYLRHSGDFVDVGDPLVELAVDGDPITVRSPYAGMLFGHYRHFTLRPKSQLVEISTASGLMYSHKIFLSYRWGDEPEMTGRIFERLRSVFGRWQLFFDTDAIAGGADIDAAIANALSRAEALVVIIGRGWMRGQSRAKLFDDSDRHRREIATAIARGIPVFPILIGDARMPDAAALPTDIAPLVNRLALRLSHEMWEAGANSLTERLEETMMIAGARLESRRNLRGIS